jgi:thiol-disulfide isomerase/thioredoxin
MASRFTVAFLGFWLLSIATSAAPAADGDAKPSVTTEEAPATTPSEASDETKPDAADAANPFEVPDGTNQELLEYINGLRRLRPRGESRDEMIESFKKAHVAMAAAAEKILANDPKNAEKTAASEAKLEALSRLTQFDHKDALQNLETFATELKSGDDAALAKRAQSVLMQLRARKLMMGNMEGAKELLGEVTAQLKADPDDMSAVRLAMGVGQALEYSGKSNDLAVKAYRDFSEILSTSSNAEVKQYAEQLEGVVRRLELIGHPMELSGTLLDGKPFDPETLKGKVVLVDFWATWCGPCIAELPNVLSNYKQYHGKGFEVVGISLDEDREALEKFVTDRELPWPTLFEDAEGSRGWANPLARKYGVGGIPTVILIGANGNVVSLNARGEKLGKLLEEQLGPAENGVDETQATDKAESSGD